MFFIPASVKSYSINQSWPLKNRNTEPLPMIGYPLGNQATSSDPDSVGAMDRISPVRGLKLLMRQGSVCLSIKLNNSVFGIGKKDRPGAASNICLLVRGVSVESTRGLSTGSCHCKVAGA